jgi:Icc-related predicted phosphoesterase
MTTWFFISDLHGITSRYQKLFKIIREERPEAVLIGGDFLPLTHSLQEAPSGYPHDFIRGFLQTEFQRLRFELKDSYPRVFLIMGNDDPRTEETAVREAAAQGVWEYIHNRRVMVRALSLYGYAYVPPTPFLLKDWERYDVSRYVDPGCVSPEEGMRSIPVPDWEKRHATMREDLDRLVGEEDLTRAIFLFHAPPYRTLLDVAAIAGTMIDHVPLDEHVGSIAIQRFIKARQPLLTLHGHIHESARISSGWRDQMGRTHCFSAAHDGPELALIRFDPDRLETATRQLV